MNFMNNQLMKFAAIESSTCGVANDLVVTSTAARVPPPHHHRRGRCGEGGGHIKVNEGL